MAYKALGPGTQPRNRPHLVPWSPLKSTLQTHISFFHFPSHSCFFPIPNIYIHYFLCLDSFPTLTPPSGLFFEDIFPNHPYLGSDLPVSSSDALNDPYYSPSAVSLKCCPRCSVPTHYTLQEGGTLSGPRTCLVE